MADVFISYKREERDQAQQLAGALEAEGYSVWWDIELTGGEVFTDVIEAELRAAPAVVVLWSSASIASDFVREESILARNLGKLLPVRIESVQPPFGFQVLNALDLIGWGGDSQAPDFTNVLTGIAGLIERGSPSRTEESDGGSDGPDEFRDQPGSSSLRLQPTGSEQVVERRSGDLVGPKDRQVLQGAVEQSREEPEEPPPGDHHRSALLGAAFGVVLAAVISAAAWIWVFDPDPAVDPSGSGSADRPDSSGDTDPRLIENPGPDLEVKGVPIVPYDSKFLGGGHRVPLPRLTGRARDEAWEAGRVLDYLHYSVVLNEQRSFAAFTAINFNRGQIGRVRREGIPWEVDPRAPLGVQRENFLYRGNDWDRGHLVRRTFVTWGIDRFRDQSVFERAISFYTATAPQHARFNRTTWLSIENYIAEGFVPEADRIILFTGPVFRDLDPIYRSTQLPRSYWMVAVAVHPQTRNLLVVRALLADQFETEADGSAELDEDGAPVPSPGRRQIDIEEYTVPLSTIAELTHLNFGYLAQYDVSR